MVANGAHLSLHKYITYLPIHSCQTLPAQMGHHFQTHRGSLWVSLFSVSHTINTPIPGQHIDLLNVSNPAVLETTQLADGREEGSSLWKQEVGGISVLP